MAQLIVTPADSSNPITHDLGDEIVTIGRDVANVIVIAHESVSSHHAQIIHNGSTRMLKDLSSSNGTMVNWETINEREINDGDIIHFGFVECIYMGIDAVVSLQVESHTMLTESKYADLKRAASSLFSKIGHFVALETKRKAQAVAIQTKIGKLKRVNLIRAWYVLGKITYETRVHPESFLQTYNEIALLEKNIERKNEIVTKNDAVTEFEKIKHMALSAKMLAEAEAFKLHIKQKFIELGKNAAEKSTTECSEPAYDKIRSILSAIKVLEAQYLTLEPDFTAQAELKKTYSSFANIVSAESQVARAKGRATFVEITRTTKQKFANNRTSFVIVFALLLCAGVVTGAFRLVPLAWTTKGQISLGDMYAEGKGVPKDLSKATEWYGKAAQSGNSDAQVKLACLYLLGWIGTQPDDDKAMFWYRKAAEQNNALGQHYLGWMYRQGRGSTKDDAEAFHWCEMSAKQGYVASECLLGLMYFDGTGVTRNYEQSAKWFRLAAVQGDTTAAIMLGGQYLKGVGVKQNTSDGIAWMEKAAAVGDNHAITELGILYYDGSYVKQDKEKAMGLLEKAANAGNKQAQVELDRIKDEAMRSRLPKFGSKEWYEHASKEDKELFDMLH